MHSHLGYDVGDLRDMMLNGIEGSWADADQKAAWREQWPAAFDALVDETDWPLPASFGR
jgi:adenosine deaminase